MDPYNSYKGYVQGYIGYTTVGQPSWASTTFRRQTDILGTDVIDSNPILGLSSVKYYGWSVISYEIWPRWLTQPYRIYIRYIGSIAFD